MPRQTLFVVLCTLLATGSSCAHPYAQRNFLRQIVSRAWRQLVDTNQIPTFSASLDTWSCENIGSWLLNQQAWRPVELQQYAKALCAVGVTGATLHAVDGAWPHHSIPLNPTPNGAMQRKYSETTSKYASAFTERCFCHCWPSCAQMRHHSSPQTLQLLTSHLCQHPTTWYPFHTNVHSSLQFHSHMMRSGPTLLSKPHVGAPQHAQRLADLAHAASVSANPCHYPRQGDCRWDSGAQYCGGPSSHWHPSALGTRTHGVVFTTLGMCVVASVVGARS